jgi:ABC-type uncharacterized transport system ATPase subunit
MASVTLEKVEKAYDGLKTVHGLDLEIADGEIDNPADDRGAGNDH